MDLCIYFLVSADLHRSRLSESFLALSKIPVEKALSELHVLTLSSNDDSPGNTNGQRNTYLIPVGRNFTNGLPISPYLW